jgi:hypothetical protein
MIVVGEDAMHSVIRIEAGANVFGTTFRTATVTGILDGGNVIQECRIFSLDYIYGFVERSMFAGGVITPMGNHNMHIIECYNETDNTPIMIDGTYSGALQNVNLRTFRGQVILRNFTGGGTKELVVELLPGEVTFEDTIQDINIIVRGIGIVHDNSVNVVLDTDGLLNATSIGSNPSWSADEKAQIRKALGVDGRKLDTADGILNEINERTVKILGLSQSNFKITEQVYDSMNRITASKIQTFHSKADLEAETNPIATYEMSCTYNAQNQLTSYKVIEV